jgi:hypothetical protein
LNKILLLLFTVSVAVSAQPEFSAIGSMPGSFSRIGFGARGIGLGNALSAVTTGNLVSYYNPAVSAFQDGNSFQTGYSFLSLDRSLNFLNFTRRFDFYTKDTLAEKEVRSSAGISVGIINSGVSKIDGRDNQGFQTGELATSENQFFLGLANRFSKKLSLGVAAKFYYYKLYEDITANNLGFDLGALYRLSSQFNLSFVVTDINSKYKWDTGPLYGARNGITSENKFPLLRKIGLSYFNQEAGLLTAAEVVLSNGQNSIIRFGIEYNIFDRLYIRGGVDQLSLNNSDWGIKPSAGFSFSQMLGSIPVGIDYAFMIEQYSSMDRHIIGINFIF